VLVANDQLVQQPRVLALQPLGNGEALLPHLLVRSGFGIWPEKRANKRDCTHLTQLDAKLAPIVAQAVTFVQPWAEVHQGSNIPARRLAQRNHMNESCLHHWFSGLV